MGVRYALMVMGNALVSTGRPEKALDPLQEALSNAREAGDASHEAGIRLTLGEAHLAMKEPEQALPHLLTGHDLITEDGYRIGLLRCLIAMSRAYRMLGDPDRALACVSEAVAAGGGLGHARWERRLSEEREAVGVAREGATAG